MNDCFTGRQPQLHLRGRVRLRRRVPDVDSVAPGRSVLRVAVVAAAGTAGRPRDGTAGARRGHFAAATEHRRHLEGRHDAHGGVVEVALGQRRSRVRTGRRERVLLDLQRADDDGFAVVISALAFFLFFF